MARRIPVIRVSKSEMGGKQRSRSSAHGGFVPSSSSCQDEGGTLTGRTNACGGTSPFKIIRLNSVTGWLLLVIAIIFATVNARLLPLFGGTDHMTLDAAMTLPKHNLENSIVGDGKEIKPNTTDLVPHQEAFKIIVLTMDRFHSLERLIRSLQATDYSNDVVDLLIRFDIPKNPSEEWKRRLEVFRSSITWTAGTVSVSVAAENMGLRKAWLTAWTPASNHDRAIIFEDDLEVSSLWYRWLKGAYGAYGNRSDIAGFSLGRPIFVAHKAHRNYKIPDYDGLPFLYKLVGSYGYAPVASKWLDFLDFAECALATDMSVNTPELITSDWYKSLDKRGMWTQLFIYFCYHKNLYTLYTRPNNSTALSSHHREKGEHYRKTDGPDFPVVKNSDNWRIEYPINIPKLEWDAQVHPYSPLRSLILSGAVGYKPNEFKRFVTNIRAHYDGDVALLVWEKAPLEIFELLEAYNIQVVKTPESGGERASPAWYKVNQVRWQFYQATCQQDKYDFCMAVDFRDTLFQDDPFRGMVAADHGKAILHVYEHNIPMNQWHLDVARQCKGNNEMLYGKKIINAGGFAGSPEIFPQLAKWILQDTKNCDDQVALNIGLYGNAFNATVVSHKQGEGSINNVAWGGKFRRDSRGRFLNTNCFASPAVHQFDMVKA